MPSYLPATRYGGPIYSVHALCAALARRGHEVHVLTTNINGPAISPVPIGMPIDIDGVAVTYFATGIGRRLYRSPGMRAALDRLMPAFDVAHLHSVFLWPTTAAAVAARRAGIPYLLSPRGMLVVDLIRRKSRLLKTAWINIFERRNLAGAAAVHATSEIEAKEMLRLGIKVRRIAIVPNGVHPPAGVVGERPMQADGAGSVLCLGRINWKKGLDCLIAAIALVPKARLTIAGNDEDAYRPQLEQAARRHGVAERVRFIGPVHGDAKWRLVASADVFALASHSENFGNAVLEAMACGVPVVVTPRVGLAQTVAAADAGLVADGDPAALAAAIGRLLDDAAERRRMGDNGRRAVSERFSWDSVAVLMEDAYREAVGGALRVGAAFN